MSVELLDDALATQDTSLLDVPRPNCSIKILSNTFNLRQHAKTLNDWQWIYGLYGALDGLNTSFSMLKYFFDAYYTNTKESSSDALHEWSLTPEGIAFLVFEMAFFISFSIGGNVFDDDGYDIHLITPENGARNCYVWNDNNNTLTYISPEGHEQEIPIPESFLSSLNILRQKSSPTALKLTLSIKQIHNLIPNHIEKAPPTITFQGFIASCWPYFRDAAKALKSTYKGVRNAFVFTNLLAIAHNLYIITPIGIILGIISAFNRIWLRSMRDERKTMQDNNERLLQEIAEAHIDNYLALKTWGDFQQTIMEKIQKQSPQLRLLSYISSAYNACVDAPYLFLGAVTLTVLIPGSWLFFLVIASSFIFIIACIATRMYEEKEFQRKLKTTQVAVECALNKKELDHAFEQVMQNYEQNKYDDNAINRLKAALIACNHSYNKAYDLHSISLSDLVLSGLKHGLYAYNAIASIMFLIATISIIVALPYSPILLAAFLGAGVICLLVSVISSLVYNFAHVKQNTHLKEEAKNNIAYCITTLESNNKIIMMNKQQIDDALNVKPHDDSLKKKDENNKNQQDWYEIYRLFSSGARKGLQSIDAVAVELQEMGDDGHYHDTDTMTLFAWINAGIFACIFAGRGFARLGRDYKTPEVPIDSTKEADPDQSIKPLATTEISIENLTVISNETPNQIPPSPTTTPSPRTITRSLSPLESLFSFFTSKPNGQDADLRSDSPLALA